MVAKTPYNIQSPEKLGKNSSFKIKPYIDFQSNASGGAPKYQSNIKKSKLSYLPYH